MSKLAQSKDDDDYPDAAEKHLTDADLLFQAGRFDGAGYLTGYVVECVLKTYILIGQSLSTVAKTDRHHRLNDLSQSALRLAAMPNAQTAKYPLKITAGHSMYDLQTGWRETIRYRAPAAVTAQQAQDWLTEARSVYAPALREMKKDGLI
jgi:hypothetical protein